MSSSSFFFKLDSIFIIYIHFHFLHLLSSPCKYSPTILGHMEESLPPGFRFHPTDEELITFYLSNKITDRGFTCRAIAVVDLNKCEPWDLPALASMGEKEWYFFNLKDRKYPTGLRTNRATQAGYWKTTGKDKEIYRGGNIVGMKKTLVFYRGRAPRGEKSNWVMHEYRPQAKPTFKSNKDEWVVCRVFKKSSSAAKKPMHSPSSSEQYNALEESPTQINAKFCENIDILVDNGDPNGVQNSHVNSLNRYYPSVTTEDQFGNSSTTCSQMYNNQSLQWNNGAICSNGSFQNTSSLTLNSLLLKALQMRSTYQPTPYTLPPLVNSDDYLQVFNNISLQHEARNNSTNSFGTEFNANMVAAAPSSSSTQHHQLQITQDQGQEQEQEQLVFSMDSIW